MTQHLQETEDLYPSRTGDETRILPRHDPVIHCDPGRVRHARVGAADVAAFRDKGYLFVDSLFDEEEVGLFRAELDKLRASDVVRRSPGVVEEPDSGQVRSLFAVHRISRLFDLLSKDDRIAGLARQLLGSDVYVHQSRVNLKPGFRGKEFYWHSDFETWHVEDGMPRMRALSCSVSLSANLACNGPLMVIPGSHEAFVSCAGETPENNYEQSLRRQDLGVADEATLARMAEEGGVDMPTGPAGSVLFFDCNLQHGSGSNISPWPRSNAFIVYNSVANRLVKPFCGLAPRPEYLGNRDARAIEVSAPDYRRVAA